MVACAIVPRMARPCQTRVFRGDSPLPLFWLLCYDNIMKRWIFLFFLWSSLFFTGCGAPEQVLAPSPALLQTPGPSPTFTPAPTPVPTPTPVPDALTAQDGAYTIAWLSDTQYYSQKWPDTFYAMTRFLRDEQERLNLRYFVHTGDLVNSYNKEEQWEVAVRAMASLARIPGGVLAGNHDVHSDEGNYSYFSRYFGETEASLRPCYAASYADNRGHYDLWEAGNTQYIFVYMGYAPDEAAIQWVREALDSHPDRVGVLCLHDYFTTKLERSDTGEAYYQQVVAQCPNLYLVLCGHRYNVACIPAVFDDDGDGVQDRTVYQMMGNYQAAGQEGGSGYMRFLQVDEGEGMIRVYSYSPLLADYRYYDTPGAQDEKYAVDPEREYVQFPIPWRPSSSQATVPSA